MIIYMMPRASGKTQALVRDCLNLKDKGHLPLAVSNTSISRNNRERMNLLPAVICPKYLLKCMLDDVPLDMGVYAHEYTHLLFEEPTCYWNYFKCLVALTPKNKLYAAYYTPTGPDTQLPNENFDMGKVTTVFRQEVLWPKL
jgi:hypothetical protein